MKNRLTAQPFQFQPFSKQQKRALTWWHPKSPHADKDIIICDGAIRSGKTVSELISFTLWSLSNFENETLILAGKTMGALKRNVLNPLFKILTAQGIRYHYIRTTDEPRVEIGGNTYYLFGANNELAQDKIQGLTAAGAYADEAPLFPRSFVEQMIGRCSVDGAKIFLNGNPLGPKHWFKTEYIDKATEKRILYLHFTMDDNLTLVEKVKERYKRMFTGVFYQRYIKGLWVMAEGLIYDMFLEEENTVKFKDLPNIKTSWVGIDYGTANPTVYLLVGLGADQCLYVYDEYRWDSRKQGRQKTDKEYSQEYIGWINKNKVIPRYTFFDPSAKSFGLQLHRDGVKGVIPAKNAVIDGVRAVSSLFGAKKLYIVSDKCHGLIEELQDYVWDEKAQERGEDKPLKVNDHGPDALRYVILSIRPVWHRWIEDLKDEKIEPGLLPENIA